ncbi:hypothetical protein PYCC9005_005229 [Savitreella phatthalungensis]
MRKVGSPSKVGTLPWARQRLTTDLLRRHRGTLSRDDVQQLDQTRASLGKAPFERFRRQDRLSVTDVVSPLWCEAQFQYALEATGRRRRTEAMKVGSRIHDELEREIHLPVVIERSEEIEEERWGLILLNGIIRCDELLRTGVTRELSVWGRVRGTRVTGKIDELRIVADESQERNAMQAFLGLPRGLLVLSDTKTRGSSRPPTESAHLQAKLQLMLYRSLLAGMRDEGVTRAKEEGLDVGRPFTDAFIAQAMALLSPDDADKVPSHNSIEGFWQLFEVHLRPLCEMLRRQDGQEDLSVTYLQQLTRETLFQHSFSFDRAWMDERADSVMAWWHGTRQAQGVRQEEAYKCSMCDFEAGCSWRLHKVEEAAQRYRTRRSAS